MISIIMTTFNRAWALPLSLQSLVVQSLPPDEVIIILKPSTDESESIIHKFSEELPIKLIIQKEGFVVDAVKMGIENSSGKIILFIDDDAVAEENFVKKYKNFFDIYKNAGGATGLIYKAYLKNGNLIKTDELFAPNNVARSFPYRKSLKIFENYSAWISMSGLITSTLYNQKDIQLNAALCGANMGFIKKVIEECPIEKIYKRSRRGFNYESILAYYARVRGFHTYKIMNPTIAPIVWHIEHEQRLTWTNNFWSEFWVSYDVFKNYFRYKKMGADVSLLNWIIGSVIFMRRRTYARLPAFLYAIFK